MERAKNKKNKQDGKGMQKEGTEGMAVKDSDKIAIHHSIALNPSLVPHSTTMQNALLFVGSPQPLKVLLSHSCLVFKCTSASCPQKF